MFGELSLAEGAGETAAFVEIGVELDEPRRHSAASLNCRTASYHSRCIVRSDPVASRPMTSFPCRFCGTALEHRVVDLGMSPLCESYVPADRLDAMEPFYPLNVWVCDQCFLVQINEYVAADEIFTEYAYFSSYSSSWLDHARDYVGDDHRSTWISDSDSFVVELASNDGYLLQYFVERGIPCLGVEPSANVSEVAIAKGIPTDVSFFGEAKGRAMAARLVNVPTSCSATTCWHRSPTSTTSSPGFRTSSSRVARSRSSSPT